MLTLGFASAVITLFALPLPETTFLPLTTLTALTL